MTLVQIGVPALPPEPPADFHIVAGRRRMLFVVESSSLYRLEDDAPFDSVADLPRHPSPVPRVLPAPAALSLNIAQSCNLACRYCYADEGRFGGAPQMMTPDTAFEAIRRHLDGTVGPVSVGFIGGEPLLNREVLHSATRFAAREAALRRIPVTFGITTNGTLLRDADIRLLRAFPFAVNVSIDGAESTHDLLRPSRHGAGSFRETLGGVAPLLADPGKSQVAARVTVTRRDMNVSGQIEALAAAGFTEIGVSPMRTGPDPTLRIGGDDWPELLEAMKSAALADWRRVAATTGFLRFSNFSSALRQIYSGACNALPCGSSASYVSLSAEGRYYTCHRTVGDSAFDLGDLATGLSLERREAFVSAHAVDRQEPCRSCWARYLCGGGCHAEVAAAGRSGCDFIRGWLEFCISLYPEVLAARPDLITPQRHTEANP